MAAEQTLRAEREQLEAHWHQRLERAHYNAQRAARQYEAVEPENRLVARELERHVGRGAPSRAARCKKSMPGSAASGPWS